MLIIILLSYEISGSRDKDNEPFFSVFPGFGEKPSHVRRKRRSGGTEGTNKGADREESTVGNGKCLSQIKCYTRSSKATSGI